LEDGLKNYLGKIDLTGDVKEKSLTLSAEITASYHQITANGTFGNDKSEIIFANETYSDVSKNLPTGEKLIVN